jgi:hypothetical protein
MNAKKVVIISAVLVLLSFVAHKVLLERAGRELVAAMASIVETQSGGRYKLATGAVRASGVFGLRVQGLRVTSKDAINPIITFETFSIRLPASVLWASEPVVKFQATGPLGGLAGNVKLDRVAFRKGFIHQVSSSYRFNNFNVGPLFDDMLTFYFTEGSLLRSSEHSDFNLNDRSPVKRLVLSELKLNGNLSYRGASLQRSDFGDVSMKVRIASLRMDVPTERGVRRWQLGAAPWEMKTRKRTFVAPRPIVLSSKALRVRVVPRVEVGASIPHRWATFLSLDLEPLTKEGQAFAKLLTEDWRCGVDKASQGKAKLLVFFQIHRLGCMVRPQ